MLRLIIAVVRPSKAEAVKDALREQGICGLTMVAAQGYGRQGAQRQGTHSQVCRGETYPVEFMPKVRLEVVVEAELSDMVVDTIVSEAESGEVGDGRIWIMDVAEAVRIRTAERGVDAV